MHKLDVIFIFSFHFFLVTLLQPKEASVVFKCNLDTGSCPNGPFTYNQTIEYGSILDIQPLQGIEYRLTDVTSISNQIKLLKFLNKH